MFPIHDDADHAAPTRRTSYNDLIESNEARADRYRAALVKIRDHLDAGEVSAAWMLANDAVHD